jgi:hypothetical protein
LLLTVSGPSAERRRGPDGLCSRNVLEASAVVIALALLASYLPARRAARINPLVALRDE